MDCIHPPPTLFWLGDLGLFSPIKPPNSQIIRSSMQCPSSKENGTKNPSFYLEELLQESHEGHIKSVSHSQNALTARDRSMMAQLISFFDLMIWT